MLPGDVHAGAELTDHAFDLCQRLLRIDTTNPPGGETVAAEMLAEAGLEPGVLESAPGRGSVVARLKGKGTKPPLLLTGHLDVVEADPEKWSHPPFSRIVKDGCLWGRGAIDMKNHCATSVAILTRLAREKVMPERDIIFAGVADEEAVAGWARSGSAASTRSWSRPSTPSARVVASISTRPARSSSPSRSPKRASAG